MITYAQNPITDDLAEARRLLRFSRPVTPDDLHLYIRVMLGFEMPRMPMIAGHSAPFDYICHSFFEDAVVEAGAGALDDTAQSASVESHAAPPSQPHSRDCIVWANRGGGKTQIAAIVTLLDLLFKPGIQVRILGGSFEQSSKMYRYLKTMLESPAYVDLIAGNLTGRFVELVNGSRVEVLSQSECAVRGQRVHKLRCDEVELFHRDIWDAAQLVTRSGRCGDVDVTASIEVLSTMHKPFGLMHELVTNAANQNRRVFRWNVMDTLARCPEWRLCGGEGEGGGSVEEGKSGRAEEGIGGRGEEEIGGRARIGESRQNLPAPLPLVSSSPVPRCPLWSECNGRAKLSQSNSGFFQIEDAIQQKRRVGPHTWAAEMLCEKPNRQDSVYPEFDAAIHVFDGECIPASAAHVVGGIDFGLRDPTVMLWAVVDEHGTLRIVDELIRTDCITDDFIALARERGRRSGVGMPQWIGADPAGHQRSEQTGISTITAWKRAGFAMRTRPMGIEAGVQEVRRRLLTADGAIGLRIHGRCVKLIEAISMYHYPPDRLESLTPVKDGPDHAADALRYLVVNMDRPGRNVQRVRY